MSSSRRLLTLALGLLSIGFIGCSAPVEGPSGLASVRKVFVTETQSAGVTEADALGDAVHDAAAPPPVHGGGQMMIAGPVM